MKKVLVVDNHVMMLKFVESLLGKKGYEVRTAEDGIAALDIVKEYKPDVIFVDLVMPYIRGEKLVSILRAFDELKDTRIVILSGIAAEISSDHVDFGADACIAKGPFNKMGEHITGLLNGFESGSISGPVKEVIGTEDVYKRAITTELIAGRRHSDIIIDSISDGILELNKDFRIVYANNAAKTILKVDEKTLITSRFSELCIPQNGKVMEDYFKGIREQKSLDPVVVVRDGLFLEVNIRHIITETDESYIVIMRDVTHLKQELIAKEKLIKEVFHRVKNNLALISSIVNLQIGDTDDEHIRDVLYTLKSRMDSIALVHGQIYKGNDFDYLDFVDFAESLFSSIVYSEIGQGKYVVYNLDLPRANIDIDTAIPLGLIITELISNTIKYGFTGEKGGEITLSGSISGETMSVVYKDNGTAGEEYFSFEHSSLLSLQLLNALCSQIGSEITFKNNGGAEYRFSIPVVKA